MPSKLNRYARWVVGNLDSNQDLRLQMSEWKQSSKNFNKIDRNHDQFVTVEEVAEDAWMYALNRSGSGIVTSLGNAEHSPPEGPANLEKNLPYKRFFVPSNRLPEGLPEWFLIRDQDGDAQLTLGEFAPEGRGNLSEFYRLDGNSDRILTSEECVQYRKSSSDSKRAE